MTDPIRWPKQNGTPTSPRHPYNYGRWPESDDCPLARFAKSKIGRQEKRKRP